MNYIIFDLEWNQAPSESEMVTLPVCLEGEIIEIGAVKLNDKFEIIDELKLYIKPQYYTKLHRRIVTLTGIRDQLLNEQGLPFPEAFEKFQQWCGETFSYVTWSNSDLPVLIDNMILHRIDISNLPDTYDLQSIFCKEIMRFSRQLSLDDALKVLNERGDIAHDALHDARNTVLVCNHIEMDEYLDDYVSQAFAEIPNGHVYDSPNALLQAPELLQYICPCCGESVHTGNWVHLKHDEYITMGRCSNDFEIYLSMNIIRSAPSRFHARRILYEMSNSLYEDYDAVQNELEYNHR